MMVSPAVVAHDALEPVGGHVVVPHRPALATPWSHTTPQSRLRLAGHGAEQSTAAGQRATRNRLLCRRGWPVKDSLTAPAERDAGVGRIGDVVVPYRRVRDIPREERRRRPKLHRDVRDLCIKSWAHFVRNLCPRNRDTINEIEPKCMGIPDTIPLAEYRSPRPCSCGRRWLDQRRCRGWGW